MELQELLYVLFGVLFILIVLVDIQLYLQNRKIAKNVEALASQLKELTKALDKMRKRI
jgi:uncharacterized membrane protein YciS (DUF1049 family)